MQKVLDLNFLGAFLTCQVFAKDMVGREGCNILNISSASALRPLTRIPVYSGAVAALSNFTQWLAVHFARAGIRVNAIAPGFFIGDQNRAVLINPDGSLTDRSKKVLAKTPMKRFGDINELNGAYSSCAAMPLASLQVHCFLLTAVSAHSAEYNPVNLRLFILPERNTKRRLSTPIGREPSSLHCIINL